MQMQEQQVNGGSASLLKGQQIEPMQAQIAKPPRTTARKIKMTIAP